MPRVRSCSGSRAVLPSEELFDPFEHARQFEQGGLGTQRLAVRPRRIAGPRLAGGNVAECARAGGEGRALSDCRMPDDADLATEHRAVLQVCRASNASLRRDETQATNAHVVRDLHEVVDLRAGPDDRVVDAAAIDGTPRAD